MPSPKTLSVPLLPMPDFTRPIPDLVEGRQTGAMVTVEPPATWQHLPGVASVWLDPAAVLMPAAPAACDPSAADPDAPLVIDVVGVADHQHHGGWVLMVD